MKTEAIASVKPVVVSAGVEKVRIVTETGKVVWANKDQFIPNSKNVSFDEYPAGSEWSNKKTGASGKRKYDTIDYVGCDGKAQDLTALKYLLSQGITPTFSLS